MTSLSGSTPDKRNLLAYVALAIAYVVTGKLALLLALPPGYASAIFPPAGIAVAAAFIGGKRTLPWTLLGSLLLNLWVDYSPSQAVTMTGAFAASLIALASMLQAAVGGIWLRRAIGYPSPVDKASDVLRFLLLAPAICLVSASLSVGALTLLGIFDPAQMTTNWAAWWIGDTLGVIVMLPLVLVIAGEPRERWRSREFPVAVPMLLAFSLFVFVFIKANRWEQEESLVEFRAQSQQITGQIQTHFQEQEFLLEEIEGFFSHDLEKSITRDEFSRFVGNSINRFPAVQAMVWAARVDHSQRARFEAAQRAKYPDFEIRERDAAGRLKRAADRSHYYPITFVEPTGRNLPVLGFDLASTEDRRQALSKTLERRIPVATQPLRLIQEQARQPGIALMLAVNHGGSAPGIVLTMLRVKDFIDKTLPYDRSTLQIRLTDRDAQQLVYDNFDIASKADPFEHILNYGTREYRLEFLPSRIYLVQHRGWQSWTVLAVGLFGTGLLGALLLLGTGHTARVESLVAQRTAELLRTEGQLKEAQRMTKIGSWEFDIGQNILTWSDEIYRIFEIDPALFGASYETFLAAVHPDDRAMVDSAYQDSLIGRKAYEIDHRLLLKDGRIKHVHERCETFFADDGKPLRSIGTVQDITTIKLNEEALRESEERFRTVADYNYDWEYWLGANKKFFYISPSCERITGYLPKEFIDDPDLLERIVLSEDRHLMDCHISNYQDNQECSLDFRILRKNGEIRWIAHGCRPVH
ncbi:MAG: CHASE domain-containing protein, partial [Sterolibacterium sp.]